MLAPARRSLSQRLADPVVSAFGAGVFAFLGVYLAWLLLKPGGEAPLTYLSNIGYHIPLIVATITLTLAAVHSKGLARGGWSLAAIGTASLAIGEIVWTV